MKTPYRLERSREAIHDLHLIVRFLIASQTRLGIPFVDAKASAEKRLRAIRSAMNGIASAPHQGTQHPTLKAGLRHVAKERDFLFYGR